METYVKVTDYVAVTCEGGSRYKFALSPILSNPSPMESPQHHQRQYRNTTQSLHTSAVRETIRECEIEDKRTIKRFLTKGHQTEPPTLPPPPSITPTDFCPYCKTHRDSPLALRICFHLANFAAPDFIL